MFVGGDRTSKFAFVEQHEDPKGHIAVRVHRKVQNRFANPVQKRPFHHSAGLNFYNLSVVDCSGVTEVSLKSVQQL